VDISSGESILTSMASFDDEAGSPSSIPLCSAVSQYLRDLFLDFKELHLPPGVYGRIVSSSEWIGKSTDEKKLERMKVQLSAGLFDTWAESLESHILGAILTITILRQLAHLIRGVFCPPWILERLGRSHLPISVPYSMELRIRSKAGELKLDGSSGNKMFSGRWWLPLKLARPITGRKSWL
jgi:hypothetical protein